MQPTQVQLFSLNFLFKRDVILFLFKRDFLFKRVQHVTGGDSLSLFLIVQYLLGIRIGNPDMYLYMIICILLLYVLREISSAVVP